MADATRAASGGPSVTDIIYGALRSGDLLAGEDLPFACPVRIDPTDGLVYKSNGTAADADANCEGFTPKQINEGEPVDLVGPGVRMAFADAGALLTPGARYYVSTNAGELSDAATTGGVSVIAWAITDKDIVTGPPLN